MEYIIIAVIIVAVIAFIAYPLFTKSRGQMIEASNPYDTIVSQRDSAYAALRDLDLDFQLGKLSESDYTSLRDKYKARAAVALQELDAAHAADAQAALEAQVAQIRQPAVDDLEAEIARVRSAKTKTVTASAFCAKCGTARQPGDQFCAKCGSQL